MKEFSEQFTLGKLPKKFLVAQMFWTYHLTENENSGQQSSYKPCPGKGDQLGRTRIRTVFFFFLILSHIPLSTLKSYSFWVAGFFQSYLKVYPWIILFPLYVKGSPETAKLYWLASLWRKFKVWYSYSIFIKASSLTHTFRTKILFSGII